MYKNILSVFRNTQEVHENQLLSGIYYVSSISTFISFINPDSNPMKWILLPASKMIRGKNYDKIHYCVPNLVSIL